MKVECPIPASVLPAATRLWWRTFRPRGLYRLAGPRRPVMRPERGLVALDPDGRVLGVMGLRDAQGGFADAGSPLQAAGERWLYRPAPPTADLVIDGLVSLCPGHGAGRALIAAGLQRAHAANRPGLRAEVRADNRGALAFYRALGFAETARGPFGWRWGGTAVILRHPVPDLDTAGLAV